MPHFPHYMIKKLLQGQPEGFSNRESVSVAYRDGDPLGRAGPLLRNQSPIEVETVQRADGTGVAHGQGRTDSAALVHQSVYLSLHC